MRKSCNGKGNQVSKEILPIAARNSEAVLLELQGQSIGNQFKRTRKKSYEPAVVAGKKKLNPEEECRGYNDVFRHAGVAKVKMNDVADKNNYQLFFYRVNLIHSR